MIRIFSIAAFLFLFVSCQESFDKRLAREAGEFTREKCPFEPQPGCRLDSTTYEISSRTYTLWYSISAESEAILKRREADMRLLLVKELHEDVNYKALKDEGVIFHYVYRSQLSGNVLFETRITKEEYR